MFLNEVHEILQVAFGWTDCHLHQFGSGPRYHGPETEYYLCPYQVEEGEPGVPEEEVRLDEVIADPGDTLCYLYDFGDNWQHVIRLEAIAPWDGTAPAAVCLDGRRDGPAEDCGGLDGSSVIRATWPAVVIPRLSPTRRLRTVRCKCHARRPYQPFQCAAHPMARKGATGPPDQRLLARLARRSR